MTQERLAVRCSARQHEAEWPLELRGLPTLEVEESYPADFSVPPQNSPNIIPRPSTISVP